MKRSLFLILLLVVSCARFSPNLPENPEKAPLEPLVAKNYYLSDLRWENAKNSYGPFEKDSSNATNAGGDGQTFAYQ